MGPSAALRSGLPGDRPARRADKTGMDRAALEAPDRPEGGSRFFGYPDAALAGTWTIADLCRFLQVSERKARALMGSPDAPPPLRTGSLRCARWSPYEVIAWVHGAWDPQARLGTRGDAPAVGGTAPGPAGPDAPPRSRRPSVPAAPSAPGRPWSPPSSRGGVR